MNVNTESMYYCKTANTDYNYKKNKIKGLQELENIPKIDFTDEKEGNRSSDECQVISKTKELLIDNVNEGKYDDIFRLWNIKTNKNEMKRKFGKIKSENEIESSGEIVKSENDMRTTSHIPGNGEMLSLSSSNSQYKILSQLGSSQHKKPNTRGTNNKMVSQHESDDSSLLFSSDVKFDIVFTCSLCEYVFPNKYSLMKHKSKHNFCQYCQSKFKSLKGLTNHKNTCVFGKCMNSHPKVNVVDIALSKKIKLEYKYAFENFEHGMGNIHNKISVKSEPIEYDDDENVEQNFNENDYYPDQDNIVVKSELMDIDEEQILSNTELNHQKVKQEQTDSTAATYMYSISNEWSLLTHYNDESNCKVPTDSIHSDLGSKRNEPSTEVDADHSDNESEEKRPRFCRFKSESHETQTLYEELPCELDTEKNFNNQVDRHQLDMKYLGLDSGKMDNRVLSEITEANTECKTDFHIDKKIIAPIKNSPVESKINPFFKTQLDKTDSKLLSLKPEMASLSTSIQAVNEKNHTSKIEMKKTENNFTMTKNVLTKVLLNNVAKEKTKTKVKYIRLTDKPNLNLFLI